MVYWGEGLWYFQIVSKSWKVKERDKKEESRIWRTNSLVFLLYILSQVIGALSISSNQMAGVEVDELVVHLEKKLELSTMEQESSLWELLW